MLYPIYQLKGRVKVRDMGFVQGERVHPDRILDYWVLGIVIKGSLQLQIGHAYVTLNSNSYYLLPPFIRHWGIKKDESDIIFFHWDLQKDDDQAPRSAISLPLVGKLPVEINYLSLYQFLKRAVDFTFLSPEQVSVQIAAILAQLSVMQHYDLDGSDLTKSLAYCVMNYLRAHVTQEVGREQIATDLGYSYGHLDRVFRQQFGISLFHKRQQLCIETAIELLLMGKTIKEVAMIVGFHDYHYFLKVFKKVQGFPPGKLRVYAGKKL